MFKVIFDNYDKDKDGSLTNAELSTMLTDGRIEKMPQNQIDFYVNLFSFWENYKIYRCI